MILRKYQAQDESGQKNKIGDLAATRICCG